MQVNVRRVCRKARLATTSQLFYRHELCREGNRQSGKWVHALPQAVWGECPLRKDGIYKLCVLVLGKDA